MLRARAEECVPLQMLADFPDRCLTSMLHDWPFIWRMLVLPTGGGLSADAAGWRAESLLRSGGLHEVEAL
jgi:hypothetical protein